MTFGLAFAQVLEGHLWSRKINVVLHIKEATHPMTYEVFFR